MNAIDTILDEIIRREGGITRPTGAGRRTSASPRRRWAAGASSVARPRLLKSRR